MYNSEDKKKKERRHHRQGTIYFALLSSNKGDQAFCIPLSFWNNEVVLKTKHWQRILLFCSVPGGKSNILRSMAMNVPLKRHRRQVAEDTLFRIVIGWGTDKYLRCLWGSKNDFTPATDKSSCYHKQAGGWCREFTIMCWHRTEGLYRYFNKSNTCMETALTGRCLKFIYELDSCVFGFR
jgi:hypothetical protein